jgi:pimeloyl-ACP methyl ester carboxylesterase
MRMNLLFVATFGLFLLLSSSFSIAGNYVRVSPDLELYYEDSGNGRPLIFITGWTGTTEFFAKQIPHFSKRYRAVAYDPRSQGRSSKTLDNNNYAQHGHDLRAFMQALQLKDAVLIGWSSGCNDAYAYVRSYGTDNIRGLICIDQTPRPIPQQAGDWAEFANLEEVGGFINATVTDRRGLMKAFLPTMLQRKIKDEEVEWALDQVQKTPNYAATLLAADTSFVDYTPEAKALDGKISVLNVLSEAHAPIAKAWLSKNAPNSETFVLGNHMAFWEYPEQFNAAVERFLQKVKRSGGGRRRLRRATPERDSEDRQERAYPTATKGPLYSDARPDHRQLPRSCSVRVVCQYPAQVRPAHCDDHGEWCRVALFPVWRRRAGGASARFDRGLSDLGLPV